MTYRNGFSLQIDSDLEEIDIREAFTIFDNVSLSAELNCETLRTCMRAGWEWTGDEDRAETCHDEHGREALRGGMRLPG